MAGVLFRERTAAVDALVRERRALGIDRLDEVWEGMYVVNPPPSVHRGRVAIRIQLLLLPLATDVGLEVGREMGVGEAHDHRIPDVVVFDPATVDARGAYLTTARLAVEVLSAHERIDKRPFYAGREVTEVVVVDPAARRVDWYGRTEDVTYAPVAMSTVLAAGPADLLALLDP